MPLESDVELVRRFLERKDETAFRRIVERYAAAVLRTTHAITGDAQAAEDATQETFLAASRRLRRFDRSRSLRAWLLGIAVKRASKLVRGRVRSERREKEVAMAPKPEEPRPSDEAQRRETEELLEQALDELPPDQRAPLVLHYGEGLSQREVAEAMGVAQGTAKSRIGRALEALRGKLGKRGASLAVADIGLLLESLPRPTPTPALIEACSAKAAAAGAGLLAGKKLIAAALLVSAGAVATVATIERGGPPERGERRTVAEEGLPASDAAVEETLTPTAPSPTSKTETGTTEVTETVTPKGDAEAKPTATAKSRAKPGTVIINGKEYSIENLPEGIRILPRGGAGSGGPVPVITGGGGKPGRFAPRPVPGKWSKWAPPPRFRGESTLAGRVLDANGKPVKGATVYRMAEGVDRSASTIVSFEHLKKIATTGDDGAFTADRQEHGTFFVVANYRRLMNRDRGMETKSAIEITVPEKGTLETIELRVPASVAELVPFKGVVRDEEGKAVEGAQVFIDFVERRTDESGRFDAGLVPVGQRRVIVRKTGYETIETPVPMARGRENLAELTLVYREKGEMRLAGQVVDDAGNPVVDATVYLSAGFGTVRAIKSDASGSYVFEKLPDRLAHETCKVHVYARGCFPQYFPEVPMPADPYELRVERAIPVVITVVSAPTGEPLKQIRGKLELEKVVDGEVKRITRRSWSVYREDGVLHDLECPAGKVFIELEAAGHELIVLELDLTIGEGKREMTIPLNPVPDEED
ncbi:MAG: sigma-70 family RNA polymerase sigma factor [Planctomycetota bacterium]|jgi:RNA polymerase sigma factor (sigma-70 family)